MPNVSSKLDLGEIRARRRGRHIWWIIHGKRSMFSGRSKSITFSTDCQCSFRMKRIAICVGKLIESEVTVLFVELNGVVLCLVVKRK